jgi:uncharacterized glyoxalase superfamily protein PhnB
MAKKATRKATKGRAAKKAASKKVAAKRAPAKRDDGKTLRLSSMNPSLTVNDLGESMAWYRDVLGCQVGELWQHEGVVMGAELKAGDVTIMVSQDDWKMGRDRVKGQGIRFYCSTTQDVDKMAAGIKARGGTLVSEPKDEWGMRAFAIADPDGFKITIAKTLKR